jgi:hypothetical protein
MCIGDTGRLAFLRVHSPLAYSCRKERLGSLPVSFFPDKCRMKTNGHEEVACRLRSYKIVQAMIPPHPICRRDAKADRRT